MNTEKRLLKAWNFEEADRVPIEINISPAAREYPEAEKIVDFIDNEADNFIGVPAANWGFFGIPVKNEYDEIIEQTDTYFRKKHTIETEAGEFFSLTKHDVNEINKSDFHWEKRFIHTFDDLVRLAEAPRKFIRLEKDAYCEKIKIIGENQVPIVGCVHPLGNLVRYANMDEVYMWIAAEPEVMHKFLESANNMVIETIEKIAEAGMTLDFYVVAHEMLIPPWMGGSMFDEFVFQYDKRVNDVIHKHGGRLRAHCHDKITDYLKKFNEMGIDSLEPLEPAPFGDVDLAEAKKLVGNKMLLSGNVDSTDFMTIDKNEVKRRVKEAIDKGAPGGGFSLRTTGGQAATGAVKTQQQMIKVLENVQVYIDTALEYGRY